MFENVIVILIVLSTTKLVVDTYIREDDESTFALVSKIANYVFNFLFLFEAIFKAIAMGFVQDKGSYLRESWNMLDFFIVVTSMIDLSLSNDNLQIIRILRMLRTLRPLRFISHNSAMQVIVQALFRSIWAIINVSVVVLVVWLMFAILGLSFFKGKFFYCTLETYTTST